MNLNDLLKELSNCSSKKEYLKLIREKVDLIVTMLRPRYKLDADNGMYFPQNIHSTHDVVVIHFFAELKFIENAVKGMDTSPFSPHDELYYIGIRGFVIAQYESLN